MELMLTPIGLISLAVLVWMFAYYGSTLPFGAVSLPCISLLTSLLYFYVMPSLSIAGGNFEFFGMYLTSLEWMHFCVLLYSLGVIAACEINKRHLLVNPAVRRPHDRQLNVVVLYFCWAVTVAIVVLLVVTGKVNILAVEDYTFTGKGDFQFLNMAFSMLLPLTLIALVRDDFGPRSLALLVVVLLVLTQTGFRFRIMILLCSVVAAFSIARNIRMSIFYVAPATILALLFVNAFGMSRKYGDGVNLANIQGMSWDQILTGFGGEVGPVFTLASLTSNPLPDLVMFEPWTVAVARMVPSAIWPDKPYPDYLLAINLAFTQEGADAAGIASTQHLELLLQFGWAGLPILACLYFAIAIQIVKKLNGLSREVRIAGCALAPPFFGFFMQQRGYFFMTFTEGLFMIGPFFLVHLGEKRLSRRRDRSRDKDSGQASQPLAN